MACAERKLPEPKARNAARKCRAPLTNARSARIVTPTGRCIAGARLPDSRLRRCSRGDQKFGRLRFSAADWLLAVGRTSVDRLRVGTRQVLSRHIAGLSAAFLGARGAASVPPGQQPQEHQNAAHAGADEGDGAADDLEAELPQ